MPEVLRPTFALGALTLRVVSNVSAGTLVDVHKQRSFARDTGCQVVNGFDEYF